MTTRDAVIGLSVAVLLAGCSWFEDPAGSQVQVHCLQPGDSSAGVRCGDTNKTQPVVPE